MMVLIISHEQLHNSTIKDRQAYNQIIEIGIYLYKYVVYYNEYFKHTYLFITFIATFVSVLVQIWYYWFPFIYTTEKNLSLTNTAKPNIF